MDEEQIKKITKDYAGKSKEEVLDMLNAKGLGKYDRLKFAYQRVLMLEDFANIINKHPDELKNIGSIATRQMSEEVLPSQLLGEYVILEICSFYELIKKIKSKNELDLPELPDYFNVLKEFRNQIVAHLDKDEKFRTINDWVIKYESLNLIGVPRIIEDFKRYFQECLKIIS